MKINLNSIRDYVYKRNENYKEQEIDSTIHIYEDKEILSFTIGLQNVGNLMMGLDLFKKTYKQHPILKESDVVYNGIKLNNFEKEEVLKQVLNCKYVKHI